MYRYEPKTEHFPFQLIRFEQHGSKLVWAHFDDQGTGKAKCGVDEASQAYERKIVDAILVVGPEEVIINWERKEIPKHMPDRIVRNVFRWDSKKAGTKKHKDAAEYALKFKDGVSILLMSFAAFTTKAGKTFVKRFLKQRKVAYLIDESQGIRSPKAIRTKSILASGEYAEFKRLYSGTPMGKTGPLGMYSQIKFLDPTFWKRHGISDYETYKVFFADWFMLSNGARICKGFKNEHILNKWLPEISSRVVKADVLPDLPEKLHSRLYFELPAEHRRVYSQMENDLRTELLSGDTIEVELAITKLRKLMQICCGYVKDTAADRIHPINNEMPRVDLAVEWAREKTSPTIIWCRQTHDVDLICSALGLDKVARFDGFYKGSDRTRQLESWERGDKQHLISNTKVGGTGLTLTQAHDVLFHAVDVDAVELKQAQDRCHRPGQHFPVNYTYLIAKDTCDEKIIDAHIACEDVIQRILGGRLMELL